MAAAGIIANGVTEILKKLSSVVTNEITLVWDFNDELKNLHRTLEMIMVVMEDAEKKQLSSKTVRLWMEDLKSIAYDAEDILEEYSYQVIRKHEKEEEYKSTMFNKVRKLFSSSKPSFVTRWKLARKVKRINENLNEITKRKNDLGLQIIEVGSSSSTHELMMKNRETNSFVPEEWKTVGRENEKTTIIKMLLEEEEEENLTNQDGKHVSVIPIVGMGGFIGNISAATRRLNLLVDLDDENMSAKVLEALKKAKNLRTIIINNEQRIWIIGKVFKENKRLRVFILFHLAEGETFKIIKESTSSIDGLKHLRYFHVVEGDYIISKGIGRSIFLETLKNEFKVSDKKKNKNASGVEELEGLNLLRGDLIISQLQNVTSGTEAYRTNLKKKKNLRRLYLIWDGGNGVDNDGEMVLEGLEPHPNLRTLEIKGFEGAKFPKWIEDSSCLLNLVELTLSNCKYCEQVAGFGALPSLRSLTLTSMQRLKCIGKEFYYSSSSSTVGRSSTTTITAFPSLKKLTLFGMKSLKEWVVPVLLPPQASTTTTGATTTNYYCYFPLLEEIHIARCPLLTTITPTITIFPSLKVLYLDDIDGRAAETLVINNSNSLTSLTLSRILNLVSLPRQGLIENNNTLLSLHIVVCFEFQGFFPPNMDVDDEEKGQDDDDDDQISQQASSSRCSSSSNLQTLKLYDCPAMRFYPNIFRSLTSLRSLEIQYCEISKSLQEELTCLSSSLEHLEHVLILNNMTVEEEEEEVEEEEEEEEEEEIVFWNENSSHYWQSTLGSKFISTE